MKILGYIGVVGGLVAILLAFSSGNGGLVFVGLVAILCGVISVAVHNLRERLDSLETFITRMSQQSASAEEIVDQLRQEGMIRSGDALDEQSIEEILEE